MNRLLYPYGQKSINRMTRTTYLVPFVTEYAAIIWMLVQRAKWTDPTSPSITQGARRIRKAMDEIEETMISKASCGADAIESMAIRQYQSKWQVEMSCISQQQRCPF